jgi:hypothetical protein
MSISTGKLKALIHQILNRIRYTVVEADASYQVKLYDNAVNCDGTFTVTLLPVAKVVNGHPIVISSTNGVVTIAADVSIQGSNTVTNETGVEFYFARGQWWRG